MPTSAQHAQFYQLNLNTQDFFLSFTSNTESISMDFLLLKSCFGKMIFAVLDNCSSIFGTSQLGLASRHHGQGATTLPVRWPQDRLQYFPSVGSHRNYALD